MPKFNNSVACYASHPALTIGEHKIYGGSCLYPVVKDADIYIGFDGGMAHKQSYPWKNGKQALDVYFPIKDMSVPTNAEDFVQLIAWAAEQLKQGKVIHAGCIGGHGRTGLFLAVVITHILYRILITCHVRD